MAATSSGGAEKHLLHSGISCLPTFLIQKSETAYQINEDHDLQTPTNIFFCPATMTGPRLSLHLSHIISAKALTGICCFRKGVFKCHEQYILFWIHDILSYVRAKLFSLQTHSRVVLFLLVAGQTIVSP